MKYYTKFKNLFEWQYLISNILTNRVSAILWTLWFYSPCSLGEEDLYNVNKTVQLANVPAQVFIFLLTFCFPSFTLDFLGTIAMPGNITDQEISQHYNEKEWRLKNLSNTTILLLNWLVIYNSSILTGNMYLK